MINIILFIFCVYVKQKGFWLGEGVKTMKNMPFIFKYQNHCFSFDVSLKFQRLHE